MIKRQSNKITGPPNCINDSACVQINFNAPAFWIDRRSTSSYAPQTPPPQTQAPPLCKKDPAYRSAATLAKGGLDNRHKYIYNRESLV